MLKESTIVLRNCLTVEKRYLDITKQVRTSVYVRVYIAGLRNALTMFRKKPPEEKSIGRWWNVCSRRGFVARREYEINRDDVLTTVRRSVYLTDHHGIFFFSKRNRLNCGVSIIILVSRPSSSLINSKTKQARIEHGISTKNRTLRRYTNTRYVNASGLTSTCVTLAWQLSRRWDDIIFHVPTNRDY